MSDDDILRVVWLVAAVGFLGMEIVVPGLVMLPFGIGAGVATILAFAGVGFAGQLAGFLAGSAAAFLALRPLARRLDQSDAAEPVGALRLLRAHGVVVEQVVGDQPGLVRVDREEWRAETLGDAVLPPGTRVEVAEVRGARLVVTALIATPAPPTDNDLDHPEEGVR